jgi:hypothetical protein
MSDANTLFEIDRELDSLLDQIEEQVEENGSACFFYRGDICFDGVFLVSSLDRIQVALKR